MHQRRDVARIQVRVIDGRHHVTVVGPLVAADLRRLERACGPALEHRQPPLEIRVESETLDEPSRVFLDSLARRGAVVTRTKP
ncbi:MAG: hypothetical protein R2745_14690 [Vicinamibacterales bacterium]